MPKITFYDKYKKKTVILSDKELEETLSSQSFQTLKNSLIAKAERSLMSAIYFKQAFWIDLIMIIFAAFISTIALDYFIITTGKAGLFPSGLGSICRFLAILTFPNSLKYQSSFYFIYYFLLNIPLAIFSLYKIGVKFTITTTIYIVFTIIWDQIISWIPVINPTEWHMIIDYPLITGIPDEWGVAIWLFVFAIAGGVILGWSYALIYKVGASTGGIDFISIFFSKRRNRNIGGINRKINFVFLALVIVVNSALMRVDDISTPIRYSVLRNLKGDDLELIRLSAKDWWILNGDLWPEWARDFDKLWIENRDFIFLNLANHNDFTGYTPSMLALMRTKFIFGPSLFASILLIVIQAIVIDEVYPKYKFHTIMIATSDDEKVKKFFFDSGYQNEIFEWNSSVESSRQHQNRKLLIVTITVVNWKQLEKAVLNLNPDININVLSTKTVKGHLNIELKDGRIEKFVHNKLMANKYLLQKIDNEALVLTIKKNLEFEKRKPRFDKKNSNS